MDDSGMNGDSNLSHSARTSKQRRQSRDEPVGRRKKRSVCVEPELKMRRAQGREEVAHDQV